MDAAIFSKRESTILKLVDAFFVGNDVDENFQPEIKATLSDRQIVELS